MTTTCTHLDQIRRVEPRTPDGCEECLKTGDRWVHLRLCLTCGHVGCCDSSPNRHATRHFEGTGHPIVQSFEPNEDWAWCYHDEVILEPSDVEKAIEASTAADTADEGEERKAGGPGGLMSRLLGVPHRRNYVVGIIDDAGAARDAAEALRQEGFASEKIVLQTGEAVSERLERSDLGNLVREAMSEEGSICRDYNERSHGGAILSVYTGNSDEVELARRVLTQHDGHSLKHFGDWTIVDLQEQNGAG